MKVDSRRIQISNNNKYVSGRILYWMNRDMRIKDNWALIRAQEISLMHKAELCVVYNLDPIFLGGALRQFDFKINGLKELYKDFQKLNISFSVIVSSNINESIDFIEKNNIGYLITDFSPLKIQKKWTTSINKKINIPFEIVDTHNIVPVWEASNKKEFAAYTIRPKINKKLSEFLVDFPPIKKQKERSFNNIVICPGISFKKQKDDFIAKLDFVLDNIKINRNILPVNWCKSGEKAAHNMLKNFITNANQYAQNRNNPNIDAQSNLSPYIHYGMISPQRIALEINKSKINLQSKKDFLEELIIRRELADNFCYYEPNYDNAKGFHEFFQKEHERIKNQKRDYLYTKKQFETTQTHDDLWNACQTQMVQTGKMHGYLRMYWAKMIFAWSKNVDEAIKIAIYLNDTYELDGRDPNGYTGIAWCIGGVHDRPWYPHPVFGKIRYMSRSGMDKKFDTKSYIQKWKI